MQCLSSVAICEWHRSTWFSCNYHQTCWIRNAAWDEFLFLFFIPSYNMFPLHYDCVSFVAIHDSSENTIGLHWLWQQSVKNSIFLFFFIFLDLFFIHAIALEWQGPWCFTWEKYEAVNVCKEFHYNSIEYNDGFHEPAKIYTQCLLL
jgi:hypothetical protein